MKPAHKRRIIIAEVITPVLRKNGFKKAGNAFVKKEQKIIKVFRVQESPWSSGNYAGFSLQTGLLFPSLCEIQNRIVPKSPSIEECHFHISSHALHPYDKLFDIFPETNIQALKKYTSTVLEEYVIPFLNQYAGLEDCITMPAEYFIINIDIKPFVGLALIDLGDIKSGRKLMENISPAYSENFKKILLDYRDLLIDRRKGLT